jgi:hypothetical protein
MMENRKEKIIHGNIIQDLYAAQHLSAEERT